MQSKYIYITVLHLLLTLGINIASLILTIGRVMWQYEYANFYSVYVQMYEYANFYIVLPRNEFQVN